MFIIMFAAFSRAFIAKFCAISAEIFGFIASQAHELCSSIADSSAFHVQLNASCHHIYIFFLEAGGGAMIADCRALQTGVNTFFIMVIVHTTSIYM
jgi:hypothetical protein